MTATTTSAFLRELEKLDIRFSPEERAVLVERARKSIEESTAVMAQRERDRLIAMPPATTLIQ